MISQAISTATYVRNRLPTRAVKYCKTPYELWHGRKPNVGHLRVFGCIAYANAGINMYKKGKFDSKVEITRFIGYSLVSKGYRLYDELKREVFVRRNVAFDEYDYDKQK